MSVFKRCGLAALSDLETDEWEETFALLEEEQRSFLSKASEFRSADYKWPLDALHNWSRVWEYPYVYYHLVEYLFELPKAPSKPTVADIGSGVTFFPISLASKGYHVTCIDIDPVCERDVRLASKYVPHSPGIVDFKLTHDSSIPLSDFHCDAVYSISVLEHIADFERTIGEMARVLKPNGLCIITCDINLRPQDDLQLKVDHYWKLRSAIDKHFVHAVPELTIHPSDILTTRSNLRQLKAISLGLRGEIRNAVRKIILRILFGEKTKDLNLVTPYLTVIGLVLRKKS